MTAKLLMVCLAILLSTVVTAKNQCVQENKFVITTAFLVFRPPSYFSYVSVYSLDRAVRSLLVSSSAGEKNETRFNDDN